MIISMAVKVQPRIHPIRPNTPVRYSMLAKLVAVEATAVGIEICGF